MKIKSYRLVLFCLLYLTLFSVCHALDFRPGIYYFDNSKMNFNTVKFVAGNVESKQTVVYNMKLSSDSSKWQVTIKNRLSNIDYYTFIDSDIPANKYNITPQELIDSLNRAMNNNLRRTILKESHEWSFNSPYWVFCPLYNINHSDGYWRPHDSFNIYPSRTVPLMYINTQDSMPILSKEQYINGTLWIDNCDIEGIDSLANEESPLQIEIKGRGNTSWNQYKKPYKIKFLKKESPLGLDRSKHFVLLPFVHDWSGYLRNETGFELSRLLQMPYTPSERPVELTLNGEYLGLYFMCEKIRVEDGRVEIVEQEDYDTNPFNVSGGWLLELRGAANTVYGQYENNDNSGLWYKFESVSPEHFSSQQQKYISTFISRTDSCIFVSDKMDQGWEHYIDINTAARFYVIHEVMENLESFDGSLFLYKDWGEKEKLHFGPVWDFDNSYLNTTSNDYIFNYPSVFTFLWIRELLKFPRFLDAVKNVWQEFCQNNVLNKIITHAHEFRETIAAAEVQDAKRWRTYASIHDKDTPTQFLNQIARKAAWLNEQWGVGKGDVNIDGVVNAADVTTIYNYILHGESTFYGSSDVNGDGVVNTADITSIYNKILGFNTEE